MSPITMSSSPTVIFHRHQQSTLVLLLLLSILLYISPIHCVKPKGESKALLRVLNDVDNVLSKETKVLEELQANRFKEKKYYEIVDGDCKCSNWNPLSKCGDNSECKPDAQYKNPCKHTCICEDDLANPECRCAKEVPKPATFEETLKESGDKCADWCNCMADELLYGLTHSLPYDADENGLYHFKKVDMKDSVFKIDKETKKWQISYSHRFKKNSKKFVTSKAFINIDDEENKGKLDKLTKKDFEAKLAIDLLQYFKNQPDDRPTHANPLERQRNERCNILKNPKECKQDKTCEWHFFMGAKPTCQAKDPCFKYDDDEEACKADELCTTGTIRHGLKFYSCSIANPADQPHNSAKASEDAEMCYKSLKIPQCSCRKTKCSLALAKRFVKVADDMRRMTTSKQSKDSLIDNFQFALDMLGMLPGIGEVTDILSGALYGARKMWKDMLLSFISLMPGVGQIIGKLRLARKLCRQCWDGIMSSIDFVLSSGILIDVLKELWLMVKKGLTGKIKSILKSIISFGKRFTSAIIHPVIIANKGTIAFLKAAKNKNVKGGEEKAIIDYTADIILKMAENKNCNVKRFQVELLELVQQVLPNLNSVAKKFDQDHLIPAGSFLAAIYPCILHLEHIKKEDCKVAQENIVKGREALVNRIPGLRECLVGKVSTLHDHISGKFDANQVKINPMDEKCDDQEGTEDSDCLHNVNGKCTVTAACPGAQRAPGHCSEDGIICCLHPPKKEPDNNSSFIELQETSTTIYNNVDKMNLVNEAHEAMFDLFDNTVDDMIAIDNSKSRYEHSLELLEIMSANREKY